MNILLFIVIPILSRNLLNAQVCDSLSQVEISESSSPGHLVLNIKESNQNVLSSPDNVYLSDDLGYFQLVAGRIMLRKTIDREEYCSRTNKHQTIINNRCCNGDCCIFLGISSKDPSKAKFYVRVKVTDDNDNAPKFPESLYILEILENAKLNTRIVLPVAYDPDEAGNSVNKYEIEIINDTFKQYFKLIEEVANDGNMLQMKQPTLIVKEPLDREVISQVEFNLIARDGGAINKEGKTRIIVKILDENDNEPQFSKSLYKISVKENEIIGTDLITINVDDKDADSNGRVTINFATSTSQEIQGIFQISTSRNMAVIRLISKLDYEVTNTYKFPIVAKDHGQPPRSSTAIVDITVMNVNDERPDVVFYHLGRPLSKPFSRIYIDEGNERDDIVCLVKVSDADSVSDGLSCQLDQSTDLFFLSLIKTNRLLENKQTYELRSRISFDREQRSMYDITVVCSDSDHSGELTQSAKLQVHIKDRNDNPPRFTKTHYYGTVKENRVNENVVVKKEKVLAIDKDDAENGTVEYSISDASDNLKSFFLINKNTAIVKVVTGLDYEALTKVTLTIVARDLGNPSLSSTAKLIINVEDTNDNQIEVESSFYPFEVYENEPIGTFVGRINVTDKDSDPSNKKVIMKIKTTQSDTMLQLTEQADNMFTVDSGTGKIYTKVILDREKTNQITFNVVAYNPSPLDFGYGRVDYNSQYRETVEIPVSVTILNRNDNSPIMVLRDKQNIRAVNPEVLFYRQHLTENSVQDNCLSFPYVFVDLDDQDRSKIKTTMRNSDYFSLNMDHGVICIVNKVPPKGNYKVFIVAEDGDVNDTKSQDFQVNIIVKDDPNIGSDRQQTVNKFTELKSNDQFIRPTNKSFRNNLLYAIIGSIAAALFLLIIVILVGFKKFTNADRNFESKSNNAENVQDFAECQSFFEFIPESKYNNLSFAPTKNCQPPQSLQYKSELDFRNFSHKYIPKYSSSDPMVQGIQFSNYPTGKVSISDNYQAIQSQLSSERHNNNNNNNVYHTLSKPSVNNNLRSDNPIDSGSVNATTPIFVSSPSSDQSGKTKKSNIKSPFQSTFV